MVEGVAPGPPEPRWHWRNLRDLDLTVTLSPFRWGLKAWREEDVYGGFAGVRLGPLGLRLSYDTGNGQSWALSEKEAWERSLEFEGIEL